MAQGEIHTGQTTKGLDQAALLNNALAHSVIIEVIPSNYKKLLIATPPSCIIL